MTPRQTETYNFFCDYYLARGYAPSYDEIAAKLSLRSKSGVNRILTALEYKGLLINEMGHRRRFRPVKLCCPNCGESFTADFKAVAA